MPPYGPIVLEHYRNPRNYGDLEDAEIVREAYNPVCGDRVRIALRLTDGSVAAARFKGDLCAIGKASASLLTGMVAGRALVEAASIGDGELIARLETEIAADRMQCALLPLRALREGIAAYRESR